MAKFRASCEVCKGACCEEFVLPTAMVDESLPPNRWLALHATKRVIPLARRDGGFSPVSVLSFECRCTKLTPEGRCSIYTTRPEPCVEFEAGSPPCLAVVRRRRPGQFDQIVTKVEE